MHWLYRWTLVEVPPLELEPPPALAPPPLALPLPSRPEVAPWSCCANAATFCWNSLYGPTVVGAVIVCGWLRLAYCTMRPRSAERTPPVWLERLPVTGTVRPIVSRRIVLSLVPVHTSTLGLRIAAAILARVAADSPDFRLEAPATLTEEAFSRNVLRSVRSAGTFTPAWMWVVCAPPT